MSAGYRAAVAAQHGAGVAEEATDFTAKLIRETHLKADEQVAAYLASPAGTALGRETAAVITRTRHSRAPLIAGRSVRHITGAFITTQHGRIGDELLGQE